MVQIEWSMFFLHSTIGCCGALGGVATLLIINNRVAKTLDIKIADLHFSIASLRSVRTEQPSGVVGLARRSTYKDCDDYDTKD